MGYFRLAAHVDAVVMVQLHRATAIVYTYFIENRDIKIFPQNLYILFLVKLILIDFSRYF